MPRKLEVVEPEDRERSRAAVRMLGMSDSEHNIPYGEPLSHEQQWLVDRCAVQFINTGIWPKDSELIRESARSGVELEDFFYAAPERKFLWRRDHDGVVLSVAGLAQAPVAAPLLTELLRFVRLCVEVYFSDDEGPAKVSSQQLRDRLGMDDTTIDRIHKLFSTTEYFLTAGGGGVPPEWDYFVNDLIRKFKDVDTLEKYFKVRDEILTPRPLPPPVLTHEFDLGSAGIALRLPPQRPLVSTSSPPDTEPELGTPDEAGDEDLLVFVSWAHATNEWQDSVLTFTNLLRHEGFDAQVDLYYKNRPVDWSQFGTKWIEKADVVLIVMSAEYAERWGGEAPTGTGAGVARESITLRRLFDEDQAEFLHKVRIVLLPGVASNTIPRDIGQLSWIRVEELTPGGIDGVCRHLTGEDEFPIPDLGTRRKREPKMPPSEAGATAMSTDEVTPEAAPPASDEVALGEPTIPREDTSGRFELVVPLLGVVAPNWEKCFQTVSSSKRGSIDFIISDPRILDRTIFWTVPEADLENAMNHLRQRVASANTQYRAHLAQVAEAQARMQAEVDAKEERLRTAREKLRRRDQ